MVAMDTCRLIIMDKQRRNDKISPFKITLVEKEKDFFPTQTDVIFKHKQKACLIHSVQQKKRQESITHLNQQETKPDHN